MARRRGPKKTPDDSDGVKNYKHGTSDRAVIPTGQASGFMNKGRKEPVEFDPERRMSAGPTLSWERAEGLETGTVESTPLYIHEKIHPMAFIESLSGGMPKQSKLFDDYDGFLSEESFYRFYTHRGSWQNRIIRGASLQVMASLMEKEQMAGKVQMIYFDPPYGQNFNAMLQVNTKKRDTKGVPIDTYSIKAFRDAYENNIHSYLDNVYRILVCARNLLADSGSLFLQINSRNLHYIGAILDEVFGHKNRVSLITYMPSSGTSSGTLPSPTSFILWYAKDKDKVKYNQLYEELDSEGMMEHLSSYGMVEFQDREYDYSGLPPGTDTSRLPKKVVQTLSEYQRENPGVDIPDGLPGNVRLFRRSGLFSQGHHDERSESYEWNGVTYSVPTDSQWRVSREGLDRLAEKDRLVAVKNGRLHWKWYVDEVPGKRVNNNWHTVRAPTDKHYVVETAESVIERCMLMSTDPGDLVYDPTCGSGTTAYVAEKWGRRWITSDVSSVSTTLTRQRLTTGIFTYYHLIDTEEGLKIENKSRDELGVGRVSPNREFKSDPGGGFVYEKFPYVSAATLAYDRAKKFTQIVDAPVDQGGVTRVSSPFTVETLSPYRYEEPNVLVERARTDPTYAHVMKRVLDSLETSGIDTEDGKVTVSSLEPFPNGKCLTHTCVIGGKRYAVLIAPPDCTIPKEMILNAAVQAGDHPRIDGLLMVGFNYEDTARETNEGIERIDIMLGNASMDMQIDGLAAKKDDSSIIMIGEPDVRIHRKEDDPAMIAVEIAGFESYNPKLMNVGRGDMKNLICWMVDTDYDGKSFFARLLHFPNLTDDRQLVNFRKALESRISEEEWERATSSRSVFFKEPEGGMIAVRIITDTNMEMAVSGKVSKFERGILAAKAAGHGNDSTEGGARRRATRAGTKSPRTGKKKSTKKSRSRGSRKNTMSPNSQTNPSRQLYDRMPDFARPKQGSAKKGKSRRRRGAGTGNF